MKLEERQKQMKEIFSQALDLAERKGRDYAKGGDSLSNLRRQGLRGIEIHMNDRNSIIIGWLQDPALAADDEKTEDAYLDRIVYNALALILWREAWENIAK